MNGLYDKVEYVLQHREEIKDKAMKCLVKIKDYHSPQKYEEKLRMVYQGRIGEIK